jgi:hypothetical protein
MEMRAWRVWGSSVVLVAGLTASAKPPEVPVKVDVDGKVPQPIVQEHFQPVLLPPPRLLPESILDPKPRHGPETASGPWNGPGINRPVVPASDLDTPIRPYPVSGRALISVFDTEKGRPTDWKARAAFDMAEEHRRACDAAEARQWYREVIKLAPGSNLAQAALERLREGQVVPAGATETREPPLADSTDDIPSLQLQVLWEAARQFKEAVDSGDKLHIEKCGRSLDQALRQTKPGRNQ